MPKVLNEEAYDHLVCGMSASIAYLPDDQIIPKLKEYIVNNGGNLDDYESLLLTVEITISDDDAERIDWNGNGQLLDEAVYEEIKEIMRVLHDKDIYPVPVSTTIDDINEMLDNPNSKISVRWGTPNPETRYGIYIKIMSGLSTREFFIGKDLTTGKNIIEAVA